MTLLDDLAVVDTRDRRTCIDEMLEQLDPATRKAVEDALLGWRHSHASLARKFQANGYLVDVEAHQAVQRWRAKHRGPR